MVKGDPKNSWNEIEAKKRVEKKVRLGVSLMRIHQKKEGLKFFELRGRRTYSHQSYSHTGAPSMASTAAMTTGQEYQRARS